MNNIFSQIISNLNIDRITKQNCQFFGGIYNIKSLDGKLQINILSNIIVLYSYYEHERYRIVLHRELKVIRFYNETTNSNLLHMFDLDINNINCEQDLFQANLINDLHGMNYEFIKFCNDLINKACIEKLYP